MIAAGRIALLALACLGLLVVPIGHAASTAALAPDRLEADLLPGQAEDRDEGVRAAPLRTRDVAAPEPEGDRRAQHRLDDVPRCSRPSRRTRRTWVWLPGTCAHFVVDTDGTMYQLVSLGTAMCRHTVGLNYTAIGIEMVGASDQDVLGNPPQRNAMEELTLWLMATFHIELGNVIGHNESLTSPFHKELYAGWRCQTHGDFVRADMNVYRSRLAVGREAPRPSDGRHRP